MCTASEGQRGGAAGITTDRTDRILQPAGKDFGRTAPFLHPAPAATDGGRAVLQIWFQEICCVTDVV